MSMGEGIHLTSGGLSNCLPSCNIKQTTQDLHGVEFRHPPVMSHRNVITLDSLCLQSRQQSTNNSFLFEISDYTRN